MGLYEQNIFLENYIFVMNDMMRSVITCFGYLYWVIHCGIGVGINI
jgi:hypothetical protein